MDVLIVGAGPTRLALAGSLAKAGISVRIIDQNQGRSTESKALGVQAGTLESIAQVYGAHVSNEMISLGIQAKMAFLHLDTREAISIDLSQIKSEFNFILILKQSVTERVLENFLESQSVRVGREQTLLGLSETPAGVTCDIRHADQTVEKLRVRFVVGCDGAHSLVRHSLGIPFEGGTYTGDLILGDVKVDWPWEYGVVRTFITHHGVMACFPMVGEQRYRLILIPNTIGPKQRDPTISSSEFQKWVSQLSPKPILISDPTWLTRFRAHHRMTTHFRRGSVFLAGDAAHIHSPAGGQGMNTGIQDAFNLADKLAQVIQNKAPDSILEDYESERKPVAKKVLRSTDLVFRMALKPENLVSKGIRRFVMPKVVASKFIQRLFVQAISEVKIARKDIARRT
jgi:3-(3-hydroxy-phenyl)propionate hydroxylase